MSVELPEVIAAYKERCGVTLENARKASRMKTKGSIFVRGTWFKYGATTHFDAQRFRYRWDAKVRIACGGIVSVHATDMHREYYGYGGSKLFGLIPSGSRKGDEDVLAMQVIRHLAEMVFVPDMILAGDKDIAWTAAESGFQATVKLSEERTVTVKFLLNDSGDVIEASTDARPYDVPQGYESCPWKAEFSEHKIVGSFKIPTVAVYTYLKSEGDEEYQQIRVV